MIRGFIYLFTCWYVKHMWIHHAYRGRWEGPQRPFSFCRVFFRFLDLRFLGQALNDLIGHALDWLLLGVEIAKRDGRIDDMEQWDF